MRECETGLNVRSEDAGDLGGVLDVCQGDGRGRTNKRKPETKIRYLIGRTDGGGVHDAMDGGGGPLRAERKQLAPARPTLQSRLEGAKTRHPLSPPLGRTGWEFLQLLDDGEDTAITTIRNANSPP